jgi:hypothetical protein
LRVDVSDAWDTCLVQPTNSAMAKHKLKKRHDIKFSNASILGKASGYMDCLMEKVVEIVLHPRNFNRGRGFNFSLSWYLVTNMLKQ